MDLYSHTLCEEIERLKNASAVSLEDKEKESDNYPDEEKQEQPSQAKAEAKGMTDIDVIKIKGVQYAIKPKRQVSGTVYQLFAMDDDIYERPIGTIQKDPVEGRYFGPRF
jgi:hypothetical protein